MDATHIVDAVARELMLFASVGLLIGGLDDIAIDLVYLLRRAWRGGGEHRLAAMPMPSTPPPMAVAVAAWRESRVLGAMLATTLSRYRYPDYRIFVALYPNDPATIDAAAAVAERDPRVRLVINPRCGPTTKADNLNAAWAAIEREQATSGRAFAGLLLHDAEDVVHADELTLCATLIGGAAHADVVQLPVMPIVDPAGRLVSGHYLDDFAEQHGKAMVVRTALGAGMPLAGTGCAIATPMLRRLAAARGGSPFDPASLTEDYETGLAIAELGGHGVFARCRAADGSLIATRAYFPADLAKAARQKARWMVGIALAGWDRTGWAPAARLCDHWMRLRDRRAPLAVIVLAAAYAGLIAWAAAAIGHLVTGAPLVPLIPRWLLITNTMLLGWRLGMRISFTTRGHGWREGARAVPRFVVGNMVALAAGPRALARYVAMLRGRALVWDKTDHRFPPVVGR